MKRIHCSFLLMTMLMLSILSLNIAAAETEPRTYDIREIRIEGFNDSFISYPELIGGNSEIAEKVSTFIRQLADIDLFQRKMEALSDPARKLSVSFEYTMEDWRTENTRSNDYCSILITAIETENGLIMDQRYYPMTFDLGNGEPLPFDRLFTNPAHARKWIEDELKNSISSDLSPCIRRGSLLPVPFDRFFVSGQGDIVLYYDRDQLEFVSGYSGAVAFLYDELWDDLDTDPKGAPMRLMWMSPFGHAFANRYESDFDMAESLYEAAWNLSLYGMTNDIYLSTPLPDALEQCHGVIREGEFTDDDTWIETENAQMRGTWLITNAERQIVTGIYSTRINDAGFVTGKSLRNEWLAALGDPAVSRIIDADAADRYLTAPGFADVYELSYDFHILDGSDEEDIFEDIGEYGYYVQYILFSDQNEVLQGILFRLVPVSESE